MPVRRGAADLAQVADRINESGVIVGSDVGSDGVRHPYVLIPDRCPPSSNDGGPPEPPEELTE